MTYDRTL